MSVLVARPTLSIIHFRFYKQYTRGSVAIYKNFDSISFFFFLWKMPLKNKNMAFDLLILLVDNV